MKYFLILAGALASAFLVQWIVRNPSPASARVEVKETVELKPVRIRGNIAAEVK